MFGEIDVLQLIMMMMSHAWMLTRRAFSIKNAELNARRADTILKTFFKLMLICNPVIVFTEAYVILFPAKHNKWLRTSISSKLL